MFELRTYPCNSGRSCRPSRTGWARRTGGARGTCRPSRAGRPNLRRLRCYGTCHLRCRRFAGRPLLPTVADDRLGGFAFGYGANDAARWVVDHLELELAFVIRRRPKAVFQHDRHTRTLGVAKDIQPACYDAGDFNVALIGLCKPWECRHHCADEARGETDDLENRLQSAFCPAPHTFCVAACAYPDASAKSNQVHLSRRNPEPCFACDCSKLVIQSTMVCLLNGCNRVKRAPARATELRNPTVRLA